MTNRELIYLTIKEKKFKYDDNDDLLTKLEEVFKKQGLAISKGEALVLLENLCKKQKICVYKGVYRSFNSLGLVKARIVGDKTGKCCYGNILEKDGIPYYIIDLRTSMGAINGDIVLLRCGSAKDEYGKCHAEVIKVLEKVNKKIVGIYSESGSSGVVTPENPLFNKKIAIEGSLAGVGVKDGDRVVVEIGVQPEDLSYLRGRVFENLGAMNSIRSRELGIIRSHGIIEDFDEDVLFEAQALRFNKGDLDGRKDLRGEVIVTIDGADARDLDDAVSVKRLANGNYELGVHIADVSHYVKVGGAVEAEAIRRGTSTYFPNSVLPMLPRELSNELCSLHPNTDKLTMSVIMEIDRAGEVKEYSIEKSVINTKRRLTYEEVIQLLNGDAEMAEKLSDVKDDLFIMAELSEILGGKRKKMGGLDFDIGEPQIVVEDDKVVDILQRVSDKSHKIIEHFMVAANETVAKHFEKLNLPIVFRVHENPSEEKLDYAISQIKELGFTVPEAKDGYTHEYLNQLLNLSTDPVIKEAINKIVLKGMKRAKYVEENLGHYGLALENYCHFTSPIRRLADLTTHRVLSLLLDGKISSHNDVIDDVVEMADIASTTERNSDDAEKEVDDLWKCEFMKDKVGEVFDARVTSPGGNGAFVEILKTTKDKAGKDIEIRTGIEGLLFNEKVINARNNGFKIKNKYKIGQRISVRLTKVDMDLRRMDFEEAQTKTIVKDTNKDKNKERTF